MRLQERTLAQVHLAPRVCRTGELGGLAETFSENTVPLRASVLPEGGSLGADERGAHTRAQLRLLVSGNAPGASGDGVWVDGALWRIIAVRRWTAHIEWICEALS